MQLIRSLLFLTGVALCMAPVTVGINQRSVVHKGSPGITIAFPDICQSPTPAATIPTPYPDGTYGIEGGGTLIISRKTAGSKPGLVKYVDGTASVQLGGYRFQSIAMQTPPDLIVHNDARRQDRRVPVGHDGAVRLLPIATRSLVVRANNGDVCGLCLLNGQVTALYVLVDAR